MPGKAEKILFVTSFLPVTIFKIIARLGTANLAQAKMSVVVGLVLALIQFVLSRKILKCNTYMEKAFLGFLFAGALWVYFFPANVAPLFVDNSVTLLYFTLFLMSILPQFFGYDPFTYAIAKLCYPESVWGMPDFRIINFHVTYVWSLIFFLSCLSSFLGHGKPWFSIIIPLVLVLGVGLGVSKKYPVYYLRRKYRSQMNTRGYLADGVTGLIEGMPRKFDPQAAGNLKAQIQFIISGKGGGKWVVSIADGVCEARRGETSDPTLVIESPEDVWVKIARGEIDRPKAFMEGLYKVKGDMKILMQMPQLFGAPSRDA